MFNAQGFFPDSQRSAEKQLSLRVPALILLKQRETLQAVGQVGMVRTKSFFSDGQCAPVEKFRVDGLPSRLQQVRQIGQNTGHFGVV